MSAKTVRRTATSLAILTSLFTAYAPGHAAANTTANAYSTAVYASKGSVSPTATIGGTAGALVGPLINPVLSGLVNPLLSAVANLPQSLISGVASGLVTAGGATASTAVSGTDPWSSFPACSTPPFTTPGSCYSVANLSMAAAPAFVGTLSTATGYTVLGPTGSKPIAGAAAVTVGNLAILGIPVASGGTATAHATCPTAGGSNPSASSSLSSLSLLGGAVTASLASGGNALAVNVNGQPLVGAGSLTLSGLPVTLSVSGTFLTIDVSLTPAALFSGLGVTASSNLLNSISSSSIHLKVIVGPGTSTSSSNSAQAWGLEVGVDLSASITVNAGLATLTATIPSGGASSNLLDLKLGYASCDGGTSTPPTGAIPPGVD